MSRSSPLFNGEHLFRYISEVISYMKKVEFLEIISPPIFWIFRQIWGFYKNFFGFSAKFRDFIRIFKKAISTTSLAFRMYGSGQTCTGERVDKQCQLGRASSELLMAALFKSCFSSIAYYYFIYFTFSLG